MTHVTDTLTDAAAGVERLRALKVRQQAMWASGDYAVIGTTLQIVGETLAEAADVRSIHRVLDVAAGNGNATLAAARRFATVTSTDYVPELLERARRRADADGLAGITFEVADVERLPFADASFDIVLSTFGAMFAPDHRSAAAEMLRVCTPGGRVAVANWTPGGFVGQLLKTVGRHVPPPAGVQSPVLWGTEAHVAELFLGASSIRNATRTFTFRYASAQHMIEVFRQFYGPVHKAFLALDANRRPVLEADLTELLRSFDRGAGTGLVIPSEYLETVVTK
jgi:ubiquinone/menaquinone biosynthesis C-methylase UbiE